MSSPCRRAVPRQRTWRLPLVDAIFASDAVLDRLTRLHPKVIDLSLQRIARLLERLGHPERALAPVIHVAGTNGKGSVIAYLRAMLEAAGYRCHVYTSPHLVRFNERIRVAGQLIAEEALAELLEECETANGGAPITFFEVTTAAAFLAFARTPADVCLLETGLGGRLDATNVIAAPLLTAITPVSLDHQQFLGDDVAGIMAEKAGILKTGIPCVVSRQDRKPGKKLQELATALGAPLDLEGRDWFVVKQGAGMAFERIGKDGARRTQALPLPALTGTHQIRNAGAALAALDHLPGFEVPVAARALGLKGAEWPARLQRLKTGPLLDILADGWELWLDGGHNEAAAKTVAQQTRAWRDKPLHVIFGMLNSKDPVAFLKHLEGRIGLFRGLAIPGEENALPAADVVAAALSWRMDAAPCLGVAEGLADIVEKSAGAPARVLITGSLYLAGRVLRDNA